MHQISIKVVSFSMKTLFLYSPFNLEYFSCLYHSHIVIFSNRNFPYIDRSKRSKSLWSMDPWKMLRIFKIHLPPPFDDYQPGCTAWLRNCVPFGGKFAVHTLQSVENCQKLVSNEIWKKKLFWKFSKFLRSYPDTKWTITLKRVSLTLT